jgi:hypothetical protein
MKLPRRKFLHLTAGAASLPAVTVRRRNREVAKRDPSREHPTGMSAEPKSVARTATTTELIPDAPGIQEIWRDWEC